MKPKHLMCFSPDFSPRLHNFFRSTFISEKGANSRFEHRTTIFKPTSKIRSEHKGIISNAFKAAESFIMDRGFICKSKSHGNTLVACYESDIMFIVIHSGSGNLEIEATTIMGFKEYDDIIAFCLALDLKISKSEETPHQIKIAYRTQHGLEFYNVNINPITFEEISVNYNSSVRPRLEEILNFDTNFGKIILLHGIPGTGKSHFIRSLITQRLDYVPLFIYEPDFFLTDSAYYTEMISTYDRIMFVMEDIDPAIVSKGQMCQSFTNLLNMTDGFLGSSRDDVFIFTSNQHITDLSPAITRPGRLMYSAEFGKLTPAEVRKALKANGITPPDIKQSITLSEVYAIIYGREPGNMKNQDAIISGFVR